MSPHRRRWRRAHRATALDRAARAGTAPQLVVAADGGALEGGSAGPRRPTWSSATATRSRPPPRTAARRRRGGRSSSPRPRTRATRSWPCARPSPRRHDADPILGALGGTRLEHRVANLLLLAMPDSTASTRVSRTARASAPARRRRDADHRRAARATTSRCCRSRRSWTASRPTALRYPARRRATYPARARPVERAAPATRQRHARARAPARHPYEARTMNRLIAIAALAILLVTCAAPTRTPWRRSLAIRHAACLLALRDPVGCA